MTTEVYEDAEDGYAISIRLDDFKGSKSDYYFLKHLEVERRRLAEADPNFNIQEWTYTTYSRLTKPKVRRTEPKISWIENGF
jgi:hypothetical protein